MCILILGGQQEELKKSLSTTGIPSPSELQEKAGLVARHLLFRSKANSTNLACYILHKVLSLGICLIQVSVLYVSLMMYLASLGKNYS